MKHLLAGALVALALLFSPRADAIPSVGAPPQGLPPSVLGAPSVDIPVSSTKNEIALPSTNPNWNSLSFVNAGPNDAFCVQEIGTGLTPVIGTNTFKVLANRSLSPVWVSGDHIVCISNTGETATVTLYQSGGSIFSMSNGGGGGGGGNGVASVGLALPSSVFNVGGSPIAGNGATGTLSGTFKNQTAATAFLGPASGVAAAPTFRTIIGTDLPLPTLTTFGVVEALARPSHQFFTSLGTTGIFTTAAIASGDLPIAASGAPGAVQSKAVVASNFLTGASSVDGSFSAAQPAFTDISGTLAASQLPNPSATTLGGVKSLAAVTHNFLTSIGTTGAPTQAQPAFTDLSGVATAGQMLALPSADLYVGTAGGVPGPVALTGDCSLLNTGSITCTKTNGATFATVATSGSATDLTSGTLQAARGGAGSTSGILKANGSGVVSAAIAGTDYAAPGGVQLVSGGVTVSTAQWLGYYSFPVITTGQTITLPVSSSLSTGGGVVIQNYAGASTLQPNAADQVCVSNVCGTAGVAATLPANASNWLYTNATGQIYVIEGQMGGGGSVTWPATGDIVVSAGVSSNPTGFVPGTGIVTFLTTPSSANLAATVTGETGSGALVFGTSPTLVTPALGTPSALVCTNCTGLPLSTGITGLGTGVATLLAGTASGTGGPAGTTSPVFTTPNLGTPSAINLTNAGSTTLPIAAINATGTPSSANFLRGDGSWTAVSASPGGSSGAVQCNISSAFAACPNLAADATNGWLNGTASAVAASQSSYRFAGVPGTSSNGAACSTTTCFPMFEVGSGTQNTNLNIAGTMFDIDAPSGFSTSGVLLCARINGAACAGFITGNGTMGSNIGNFTSSIGVPTIGLGTVGASVTKLTQLGNGGMELINSANTCTTYCVLAFGPATSSGAALAATGTDLRFGLGSWVVGTAANGGTAGFSGHLVNNGSTPTAASNSVSAACTDHCNDNNGRFTVGATPNTSFILTFATAWATAPECYANDETTGVSLPVSAASATAVTFKGMTVAADSVSYVCMGAK